MITISELTFRCQRVTSQQKLTVSHLLHGAVADVTCSAFIRAAFSQPESEASDLPEGR